MLFVKAPGPPEERDGGSEFRGGIVDGFCPSIPIPPRPSDPGSTGILFEEIVEPPTTDPVEPSALPLPGGSRVVTGKAGPVNGANAGEDEEFGNDAKAAPATGIFD